MNDWSLHHSSIHGPYLEYEREDYEGLDWRLEDHTYLTWWIKLDTFVIDQSQFLESMRLPRNWIIG